MRILYDFMDGPRDCAYLPARQALMHYQLAGALEAGEYEGLMGDGFRKFGQLLFRPACESCRACQPLRVMVASFSPDRSMRRCLAANQDLKVTIGTAENSSEQIDLFNRYHQLQRDEKDWTYSSMDPEGYREQFLASEILIEEIALYREGELIGVMLFEDLPQGISLIYHFYDPRQKERGLGTFLILKAIELAQQREKEFAYLGYYVSGSRSMEYKAKFKPNQILKDGVWQ